MEEGARRIVEIVADGLQDIEQHILGEKLLDTEWQRLELAPGLTGRQGHDRHIGDEAGIDARAFVELLMKDINSGVVSMPGTEAPGAI